MSYVDAISNALAARGNALSQGELQRGQVWGNLAQNLGQLPFQAMQAHQRRNLAEVETQQRGLQNQAMQQELNFQKEMSEIMTRPGLTPEQRDLEGMNTLKKYGKLEKFQEIQSRKTQEALLIAAQRKDTPGTMNPLAAAEQARAQGVPSPVTPLPPPPTQNAFAPQGPAVPYEQMPTPPSAGAESQFGTPVHPTIPLPGRQGEGLITPTPTQRIDEKVTLVRNSGLPPNVQEQIIATIYGLPPGVLSAQARGASVPGVGLTVIELTNPANSDEKIMVQSTRGGPFVHSGTQELVPEEIARTWTKRIVSQPHYFTGSEGQPSILDVEKLLAQARNAPGNPVVADVPGVRVREQWMPVTDQNQKMIGWTSQSRPGVFVPYDQSAGGPSPSRPDLYKSGRPEAAKTAETSIRTLEDSINRIDALSKKHPEVAGRVAGNVEKVKAWAGFSEEEVDDLITETTNLRNTYLKMVSGGQVTPTEDARLSPVVPEIGVPPARLKNNIARFKRGVAIMVKVRGLGREGATDEELSAALGEPKAAAPKAPAAGGGAPKKGDRKQFPNGNWGEFDGIGWKKVKVQ